MRFSIVTPSFNQGQFIAKSLASVRLQQGAFEVEHIILDNCSTDETPHALAEYQVNHGDVFLQIIVEKDGGQTAAINKGFSLATGDIVCWLNTDEWFEIGTLGKVASFFDAHPEIDVVFGNCDFVDATGRLVKRKREHFFSEHMLIYYGCFIPSCATFVRSRVVKSGLILNPFFKVTMDSDWYIRMSKAGYRFKSLPTVLASFTWHDTNISAVFSDRRILEKRLIQERYLRDGLPHLFASVYIFVCRFFWIGVRILVRLYFRFAR